MREEKENIIEISGFKENISEEVTMSFEQPWTTRRQGGLEWNEQWVCSVVMDGEAGVSGRLNHASGVQEFNVYSKGNAKQCF